MGISTQEPSPGVPGTGDQLSTDRRAIHLTPPPAIPVRKKRKPPARAGGYSCLWCRRPDSNRHELSPATPSRWCVYQVPPLRHDNTVPIRRGVVKPKEMRGRKHSVLRGRGYHCESRGTRDFTPRNAMGRDPPRDWMHIARAPLLSL